MMEIPLLVAEFNSIWSGHIDDVHWSKSSGQGLFTTPGRGIMWTLYKHKILKTFWPKSSV